MADVVKQPERAEKLQPGAPDKTILDGKVSRLLPPSEQARPGDTSPDTSVKDGLSKPETNKKVETEIRITQAKEANVFDQDFDSPDQRTKVAKFMQDFEAQESDGLVAVQNDANGDNWAKRAGADHQIDTAYELQAGKHKVAAFEQPFHPESSTAEHRVDIVTEDHYAIECKTAWGDACSPSTMRKAYYQAETRLEPNDQVTPYRGVVVVVPDGKLTGEVADLVRRLEARNPNIRFCEKSQLNRVLDAMSTHRR